MILAICMSMGAYPDIQKLEGSQKYRQWGDFRDAFICAFFLLMVTLIFVIPGLESLGRDIKDTSQYYSIVSRITIIAFILGFIVPTWYRARSRIDKEERREDHEKQEQFTAEINNKKEGVGDILSRS